MTLPQLQILHIARRQLRLDDPDYRTILRSIARVASSKDLTHRGFEDVMAYLESVGFRHEGKPETYWRDCQDARGRRADRRQVFLIESLIPASGYALPGLCRRVSHDRTDQVTRLTPSEAHNMIEMLKSVAARTPCGTAATRAHSREATPC